MKTLYLHPILATLILACLWGHAQTELQYSKEEFNRLDSFEAHSLGKADKVFHDKDYDRAAAEYDAFILEFPRSRAIPYGIYRKGRCLHLSNKRYQAIKVYTEVLDYFPDTIEYAAAALYQIGVCHWENGEEEKAMKAWAEMAEDVDYRKHTLAAYAINKLAAYLEQHEQVSKSIEYYRQVAVDFRTENPNAAYHAIQKVVEYYVRTDPRPQALREFYEEVRTFERRPRDVEDDISKDTRYWNEVREYVKRFGAFNDVQAPQRRAYYGVWAKALAGRFPELDDYQIDLALFQLRATDDREVWFNALDKQFAAHQKEGDANRVIKWMSIYRYHPEKVKEYYSKLDFDKLENQTIETVLKFFFDGMKDQDLARNVFTKLKLNKMSDQEKRSLAHYLWRRDGKLVIELAQSMEDADLGKYEQLRYWHWRRKVEEGMPLAEELVNHPDYAGSATWMKAEMLHWSKKYEEAIQAYMAADNPPRNLFQIAECYRSLGKLEEAVNQLREIENFFKKEASGAALKIAYLYRDAGKRDQFVAALRGVMKKHPKTSESSRAHEELEKLGEKIGGGVDAE